MKKFKLFLDNMIIYGLGGAMSMAIPVIMVPVVTRMIPDTSDYGLNDLANTLITFARAVAVMGMYDAMYRMFFEKDSMEYKKTVCSTALWFTVIHSAVISVMMIIFRVPLSKLFFGDEKYTYLVYIAAVSTLTGAASSILAAPTRMQNKRKVYLAANAMGPLFSYAIAVPLILMGRYDTALPLAAMISGIIMAVSFVRLNKKWFRISLFDWEELKKLLVLAIPIMPGFIFYWIFNSCDRIMITSFIGTQASGVYAAGSKLGMASQLIYLAFSGGWQYFAFSTMKEHDQVETNSLVFEYLGIITFLSSAFMCVVSLPVYELFFTGDYIDGYIAAPYLFMAPLFQMLFQIAGNQFLVIKKTWPTMLILAAGAILNVIMNLALIPLIEIEGAAVATLLSYVFCVLLVMAVCIRTGLMNVRKRFLVAVFLFLIFVLAWRILLLEDKSGVLIFAVYACAVLALYKKDIRFLLERVKGFIVKPHEN